VKCPLRFTEGQMVWQHMVDHGCSGQGDSLLNCIEGDCAWWDNGVELCVVAIIAATLLQKGSANDH